MSNFGNSSVELSVRRRASVCVGRAGAGGFHWCWAVAAEPQPSPASVLPAGIDDRRTAEALSLHLRFTRNKAWPFCLEQVILISVHIVLRENFFSTISSATQQAHASTLLSGARSDRWISRWSDPDRWVCQAQNQSPSHRNQSSYGNINCHGFHTADGVVPP